MREIIHVHAHHTHIHNHALFQWDRFGTLQSNNIRSFLFSPIFYFLFPIIKYLHLSSIDFFFHCFAVKRIEPPIIQSIDWYLFVYEHLSICSCLPKNHNPIKTLCHCMHNSSNCATEFACFSIVSILSFQAEKKIFLFFLIWERWTWRRCATTDSLFLTKLASVVACSSTIELECTARAHIDMRIIRHLHVYAVPCVWHTKSNGEQRWAHDRVVAELCGSAIETQIEKPVSSLKSLKCSTNTLPHWRLCLCVRCFFFQIFCWVALLLSFGSQRL